MLTDKITSELDYLNIIHEAYLLRILNLGIVDTDQNPLIFDYAIPGNSKAYETTKFFYRMYMSYFFLYNLKIRSNFFINLIFKNKYYKNI
jgi:ribosomal protein S2